MVASSIFITDDKGKVLVERNYRGTVSKSIVTEQFTKILIENEDEYIYSSPIVINKGVTFCFIKYDDVYLLAVTKSNCNAMLILNFLYQIVSVFNDYFDGLDEEVIRDNFVLIYELFDEMMDFGYPQHTEFKLLKDYIMVTGETKKEKEKKKQLHDTKNALKTLTGSHCRGDNISYKKNEVFLDVIEKLNLSVTSNGNIIHSEIIGQIKMKTCLSGIPQLKLGLNEKFAMQRSKRRHSKRKSVELNDIKFHQCVRLNQFEQDRSISFVPPDGEFELMRYRMELNAQRPLIWAQCQTNIKSHSRIEYSIKIKSQFKKRSTANNVEVVIATPIDVDSPVFKTSIGCVEYLADCNSMKWKIKHLNGEREYIMNAQFGLPSVGNQDANIEKQQLNKPMDISFEIPYFTVSGIQVRYLKIVEKSGYWLQYNIFVLDF